VGPAAIVVVAAVGELVDSIWLGGALVEPALSDAVLAEFARTVAAGFKGVAEFEQSEAVIFL
jgi:hypothetical protein